MHGRKVKSAVVDDKRKTAAGFKILTVIVEGCGHKIELSANPSNVRRFTPSSSFICHQCMTPPKEIFATRWDNN
jgi:hypothetical protein